MSHNYTEKFSDAGLCERCPAKQGQVFTAQLRGSSFRGRLIEDAEEYVIDNCAVIIGEVLIANVQIANKDKASAEQDAEVLTSSFEANLPNCKRPDPVLTDEGLEIFCAPINRAVDEFMSINYPS